LPAGRAGLSNRAKPELRRRLGLPPVRSPRPV